MRGAGRKRSFLGGVAGSVAAILGGFLPMGAGFEQIKRFRELDEAEFAPGVCTASPAPPARRPAGAGTR